MRVDNDTTSYSGSHLSHSHHHHITKCNFEEKDVKSQAGGTGAKRDTYQTGSVKASVEENNVVGTGMDADRRSGRFRIGKGFVREIWDAMGDEGKSAREGTPLQGRAGVSHSRGIHGVNAALSAFRQDISYYIVNKWEYVREKIRTGIHTSLKRFGKDKDGFAMLSDAGHQTDGEKREKDWKRDGDRKGTRNSKEEIPSAYQADNHLMDSYSKTGEYCRLNENLTYQRK